MWLRGGGRTRRDYSKEWVQCVYRCLGIAEELQTEFDQRYRLEVWLRGWKEQGGAILKGCSNVFTGAWAQQRNCRQSVTRGTGWRCGYGAGKSRAGRRGWRC